MDKFSGSVDKTSRSKDFELFGKVKNTYFTQGGISEEHFWLLIEISSIHSEKVILALQDYLVFGYSRKYVIERYNVNNGYFSLSLSKLLNISRVVARLAPYYTQCE